MQSGGVLDMNMTGGGNYTLSLDLNDSLMVSVLVLMALLQWTRMVNHQSHFQVKYSYMN